MLLLWTYFPFHYSSTKSAPTHTRTYVPWRPCVPLHLVRILLLLQPCGLRARTTPTTELPCACTILEASWGSSVLFGKKKTSFLGHGALGATEGTVGWHAAGIQEPVWRRRPQITLAGLGSQNFWRGRTCSSPAVPDS